MEFCEGMDVCCAQAVSLASWTVSDTEQVLNKHLANKWMMPLAHTKKGNYFPHPLTKST